MQGNTNDLAASDTARLGINIDMSNSTVEELADRALSGVAQKLEKALSVEYTVNQLVAEATDVTNLANMFAREYLLHVQLMYLIMVGWCSLGRLLLRIIFSNISCRLILAHVHMYMI